MADESELYDGIRAQFPLTFGKQAQSQTPLEIVHSTTRREAADANPKPSSSTSKDKPFPSISSSSQAWLESFKKPNPSNSKRSVTFGPSRPGADLGPGNGEEEEEEEAAVIGPPRPSVATADEDEDEDGPVIGPPRPPPVDDEEDGPMIGPPAPPPGSVGSDSDEEMEEEEGNRYRIPQSNEIVLKGHSKVPSFLPPARKKVHIFIRFLTFHLHSMNLNGYASIYILCYTRE